jgi:lipid-binding SYLF domain-containing protein
MKTFRHAAATVALLLPLVAVPAVAQDYKPNTMPAPAKQVPKSEQQAEIRKAAKEAIEKFTATEPRIKGELAAAPGYAVFTTYGLSFMIGGAGGKGLVHDVATKKDIFMDMAQASAGVQIGASESQTLIIFKSRKAMDTFVTKGWTAEGGGGGSAGAAGKSVGGATTSMIGAESTVYTITKNGLQAGGAIAGSKFWKDKALN